MGCSLAGERPGRAITKSANVDRYPCKAWVLKVLKLYGISTLMESAGFRNPILRRWCFHGSEVDFKTDWRKASCKKKGEKSYPKRLSIFKKGMGKNCPGFEITSLKDRRSAKKMFIGSEESCDIRIGRSVRTRTMKKLTFRVAG